MMQSVIQYYENYDEEGRLFRDKAHLPEYLTTIRYFSRLFVSNSRILDACAGVGRYSFYLADKGHTVIACDLVERYVDIIKAKPDASKLAGIEVCNVLDLSRFEENSFDVVLCMGALYHLSSNDLKEKAVSDCTRVCKSSGLVVLAYIISDIDGLTKNQEDKYKDIFFCSTPREIEDIAIKCGLEKIHNISTDGIIYTLGNKLKESNDEDFQKYMEYHYSTCEDESTFGANGHGLFIGGKK